MKRLTLFIFISFYSYSYAQMGEEIYTFMNMTVSARQSALGGNANSSWDNDPNMAMFNPAMMNERMHNQAGLNYSSYLAGVKSGSLSYVFNPEESEHFFAVHGRYIDYGDLKGADESGIATGNFSANDAAVTLGYAYRISDFFTVGGNLSYVTSKIERYSSSAILADIGVVFHDIDYYTTVSAVVRNFGKQLTYYNDRREKLPIQANLGISQRFERIPLELNVTLHDLQKFNISSPTDKNGQKVGVGRKIIDHVSIGAELFPEAGFNLRAGYNFKRGNELAIADQRSFAGITAGFGIKISYFRLDYAWGRYNAAGNTHTFGLRIDIENLLAPRYDW
ncbi:type IX secretion system protein PorQ [Apibacter sp. HY039]|uniref:type IX secretion system protein PorQ n=1 Tax=Apibacter sp. HY039 TaxID=2501476 RepID=UPI000FEBEE90|nr:type IX secretion system protein PorQ [Apibacter sp. HY039]